MRKTALGIGAAALVAAAAWAQESSTDDTKVAALDTSAAAFQKLDADNDGRVSAIEAANNTQVAAQFTTADKDGDGYLSREEFQSMGQAQSGRESGMESESGRYSDPSGTGSSSSSSPTTTPETSPDQ
ncbi:MAG: EF-hand domain-containing protein [Pseudomonadota bacterium]|jgi:Ca2+-binding protein (EF-Hand superfamily)